MNKQRLSPNVYGIETEYSVMVTLPGGGVHELVGVCHSVDAKLGLYKEPSDKGFSQVSTYDISSAVKDLGLKRTYDGMLSNGGRLYVDPSGPEYATPETTSAEEAVHRSFDGDTIVAGALKNLRNSGVIEGSQLNRRIVDHNRTSRGIHLNHATNLPNEPKPIVKGWIATLNVAKGAIFGSGGLLLNEAGETEFHHSPRLSLTSEQFAHYGDYSARPLVREPFKSDHLGLNRIETVTSDALNYGWPLRASLVATNALIGVVELGHGQKLPSLSDPVLAAQRVGKDGSQTTVGKYNSSGDVVETKPLDIVREICEVVLEVDDKESYLDEESSQVINEIIKVADKMDNDIYSVANQVESVGRLVVMERKMEKDKITLDSEVMCRFDYAWDLVGGGIAETFRQKNLVGWQGFDHAYSAQATKNRLVKPPQDTRAKVRGDMIKNNQGHNVVDWQNIGLDGKSYDLHPLNVNLNEAFVTNLPNIQLKNGGIY